MRLNINSNYDIAELVLTTTDNETKVVDVPKDNLHYWYPFNLNFYYRYSNKLQIIYLKKDSHYVGKNHYKTKPLSKTTTPLKYKDGTMFHREVYKRNTFIMEKARQAGIPTIVDEDYDRLDVDYGFKLVGELIDKKRKVLELRALKDRKETSVGDIFVDIKDNSSYPVEYQLWKIATKEESEELQILGEMYTMLTLMRKITN